MQKKLLSVLILLMAAAAGARQPIPVASQAVTPAPAQNEPSKPAPTANGEKLYRLEAGDGIEIRFFYNSELNENVQIRPDGNISMHLIGEVAAAGRTVGELTAFLESKYKDIVQRPSLSIQVRSYANRKVFVGGEVGRPGMIALVGEQTALAAIMEAGGLRPTAKRGEVLLLRRSPDGTPVSHRLSLKQSADKAPQAASFALQPFDVLVVQRSGVAKANQFVDQYIRQMLPALLTAGFTYLTNRGFVP